MKKKILFYSLTVILLGVYLVILIKGTDYSQLDDAYYNFYISKDLAYFTKIDELNTYRENTLLEYRSDGNYRNQGKGWSMVDDEATWCVGNISDFYLYIDEPDRPHELVIKAKQVLGYKNYLTVNGIYQGDLAFNNENAAAVPVMSGLRSGLNRFSICTDDDVYDINENNGNSAYDGRLNLYIQSIVLEDGK